MSILEDYENECMYDRSAWFIDEVLTIDKENQRIIGRLDTLERTSHGKLYFFATASIWDVFHLKKSCRYMPRGKLFSNEFF